MSRIADFDSSGLARCRQALREATDGASCFEEAAGSIARVLRSELVDDKGDPACPLVRFYCTHAYSELPAIHQEFAARAAATDLTGSTRCLVLLGSSGVEPAWNTPHQSSGHLAIPLLSETAVKRMPMVAALFKGVGVEVQDVVEPTSMRVASTARDYEVFFVPEAAGSASVPAQQDFVIPYGIRSVLGLSGGLASGDLFAVIVFSAVSVPAITLRTFRSLAVSIKSIVVPHTFSIFADASAKSVSDLPMA